MIKLIDILLEEESVDATTVLSPLASLADEIEDVLQQASKEGQADKQAQNEAILTTTALILAIPGIIKTTAKIIGIIAKKAGIDLKKKRTPAWHKIVEETAERVDSYLDKPFNTILKPFVSDDQKRKKIANILKALTLIGMSVAGSINPSDITKVKSVLSNLVGETTTEALQTAYERGGPQLVSTLKNLFTNA